MPGKKVIVALLSLIAASVSTAAPPSTVAEAIGKAFPGAQVERVESTPIEGLFAVLVGTEIVYVTADGSYLFKGPLYDLNDRVDLTDRALSGVRKDRISALPEQEKLVFAPDQPKHMVNVFTDLDCGYCRRLHSQMDQYNELGIGVSYMFLPRGGLQSPAYDKAVSVWCAEDRHAALTLANNGVGPEPLQCDNPISDHFNLARALGIGVTPTIVAPDGSVLSGYLPPEQLLSRLDGIDESVDDAARSAD